MIYFASPYSHPDAGVREQRFRDACRVAAALLLAGHAVYSPVVHGHPLVEFGLPTDWKSWQRIDRCFLEKSDEMAVLMLDGWRESAGVQAEIEIARALGKAIRFLEPLPPETAEPPTSPPVATEVAS